MILYLRIGAEVVARTLTKTEATELAACLLSALTRRGGGWQGKRRQFAVTEGAYDQDAMKCVESRKTPDA